MPFVPAPPPPVATAAQTGAERAIVVQINRVRRSHGLRTLRISGRLAASARRHSRVILRVDALTHSPSLKARLVRHAHRARYGETLAFWPRGSAAGAAAVVRLWMHSAPHRHVLLDPGLRRVGVGRAFGRMGAVAGHAVTADFSS